MLWETILLGMALMVAPVFAKYAGYELKKLPYDLVGLAGLFFLMAAAFSQGFWTTTTFFGGFFAHLAFWMTTFSYFLGGASLLFGTLLAGLDALRETLAHTV